uniref:Uncharacterized protein n=1 Tax=Ralstonia solanacearum TaxID=305 RepID=A0A0S4W3Y6_RALSL|nr:protein of unknown function [Ralstonia solanacearum]CUV41534.1 protein of unknown function [Ralstonia solanacearum]CUV59797.1 protein of unknown function [Ralstonia solanacearum]
MAVDWSTFGRVIKGRAAIPERRRITILLEESRGC